MRRSTLTLLCLSALACGLPLTNGTYHGEPLVTLRGQLLAEPGRAPSGPVRLAIAWYAHASPGSLGTLRAVSGWPASYSAPFPERFDGSLFAPPPAEALAQEPATDGVLVAYADGNGNGELDGAAVGAPSPDTVLGSSLGEGGSDGYRLVYLEAEAPGNPPGLSPGFNLVSTRTGVVAFSTSVPILLTASPTLQKLLCRTAGVDAGLACTEDSPLAALRVSGSLGIADGNSSVELSVEDALGALSSAAVSVNQRPIAFSASKQRYSALEGVATFLKAGEVNQVSVRAAGYQDLDLEVPLAGTFQVTAPAFNASLPTGAAVTVAWTAASGARVYRVRIFDASLKALFDLNTEALTVTAQAIGYTGAATLNVSADSELVRTDGGSLVVPYVNQGLPLRFQ